MSCIGQGPIVEIQNQLLNFGKIPVLKDKIRTLQLSNRSPIAAHFTASLVGTSQSQQNHFVFSYNFIDFLLTI